MTFMCGWAHDLNNTNLTFENSCLVSLNASQLSDGRLLEYVEIVNYLKSIRMTFSSLSIACLWSVYVDATHVISTPRPSRFSACNTEMFGWAWIRGYTHAQFTYTYTNINFKCSYNVKLLSGLTCSYDEL